VWFKLIGKFNAYNLTAVYGTAILLEEIREEVLTTMSSLDPVPGRFERVFELKDVMAIVDFAHTPDALQNVLETIDEIRTGNEQVITVVGAGGDRDRAKRPLMAEIACRMSDRVILTSDNPRSEDPDSIIKDMEKGVQPSCIRKTLSITDRREAIKTALMLAKEGDIILVAGKGHETYQEIKGVKYDFDDRKVLVEMMKKLSNN
jgi:UDP-N-acetylmuramoyl-L-alanyl-D-glutamate--2,6-diaminopimelate ligase